MDSIKAFHGERHGPHTVVVVSDGVAGGARELVEVPGNGMRRLFELVTVRFDWGPGSTRQSRQLLAVALIMALNDPRGRGVERYPVCSHYRELAEHLAELPADGFDLTSFAVRRWLGERLVGSVQQEGAEGAEN